MNSRHFFTAILLFTQVILMPAHAETRWKRVEASSLTLVGKAFDTPNPYHRIDTCAFKGFDNSENKMCRYPAGLAVLFTTDADTIGVSAVFGKDMNTGCYRSYRGVDLYIQKEGIWKWAGMNDFPVDHNDSLLVKTVVKCMDSSVKKCILFLPLMVDLTSLKICVPEKSHIEALESPFRHKIVFHGSSFTHGVSTARAGMSYPVQFMRRTGLQVIPMGFNGHCKMQDYFCTVMEQIDADAFVFDSFSNPSVKMIKERLLPFIDRLVKAHPGKPLIFQRTIMRGYNEFNVAAKNNELARMAASDSLMKIACKKYKDVYYIFPNADLKDKYESSSADGTHPNDNGYTIWEQSIEKPILKILRKYGIK